MSKILKKERIDIIMNFFSKNNYLSYSFLEEKLASSPSTIRRDVNMMESLGLINKISGGIEIRKKNHEIEYSEKIGINLSKKKKVAKNASKFLEKNDIIFLDSGTTTFEIIPFLKNLNITVVTNCITHLESLSSHNIKTILLGGTFKSSTKAIIGPLVINALENYNFDKAFIGTNAIHEKKGFSTPDIEEALIKKYAIKNSKKVFILADTSKLNLISNVKFLDYNKAILITEKGD